MISESIYTFNPPLARQRGLAFYYYTINLQNVCNLERILDIKDLANKLLLYQMVFFAIFSTTMLKYMLIDPKTICIAFNQIMNELNAFQQNIRMESVKQRRR